ncbi:MAG TPA: DUF6702 family protein [Flavobacterium sp.]|nr:DUF6702 family protein [Flavobacterium sp.]
MKRTIGFAMLLLLFMSLSSMAWHKFYVSINQVDFVPKKKALEITSRIFVDDLDAALEKKFKRKAYLASSKEASDSKELLQEYFDEKIIIKVNGQQKKIVFLGKELEDNVLICYLAVREVSKIASLEIQDTALMELYDQQHIFHTQVLGQKQSLLLTNAAPSGMLKY